MRVYSSDTDSLAHKFHKQWNTSVVSAKPYPQKNLPVGIFVKTILILVTYTPFCLRCSSKNGNQEEYVDRNGIKVVVGHYVGPSLKQVPNATLAEINANNFHPEPKAGKDGRPVMTPPKDLFRMQKLFQINRFNLLASDRIALNRTLPDVRRKK